MFKRNRTLAKSSSSSNSNPIELNVKRRLSVIKDNNELLGDDLGETKKPTPKRKISGQKVNNLKLDFFEMDNYTPKIG